MKRTLLLLATLVLLLLVLFSSTHVFIYAQKGNAVAPLATSGVWREHPYDLLYTVALSSEQQPNGPLIVYRALGADLQNVVPIIAVQREPLNVTPLLFPSPDGRYLALSIPLSGHLSNSTLSLFSSDGKMQNMSLAHGLATNDNPIWSANSQVIYYHTVVEQSLAVPDAVSHQTKGGATFHSSVAPAVSTVAGYDEIHRVDLAGHDSVVWHHASDGSSLRLVGVDANGALVLTLARPQQAVALLHLAVESTKRMPLQSLFVHASTQITMLPSDITPGNVLRVVNNGTAIECERVSNWQPLNYTLIDIDLTTGAITRSQPLFATPRDVSITPLSVAT